MKLSPGLLFNGERLECKLERGVMKMAKLKRMLTRPGKNESGQGALAMVLLLLMLGVVILTPLLVFMSTGVKAGQVYESKLQEFYAADAGVEDAIWEINNGNLSAAYFLGEEVNDRNVSVTIQEITGGVYKINSTATSDSGGNTTIECYYGALDYSSLLDNAITTNDTLKIQPNNNITGNISTPDCSDVEDCDNCPGCLNWTCCVDCFNCTNCCSNESLSWPTAEELSEYYLVETPDPYPTTIDVKDTSSIGPLYREGDLNIDNTGSAGAVLNLTGTIYVTGNFECKQAGAVRNYTINLNNQTIYCEGSISVSDSCTIIGSGCIIAVGDVYFVPKGDVGSPDNFVFIMSVEGTTTLQPSGSFYGAVAGNAEVDLLPGNVLYWTSYEGEGIDFPIGQTEKKVLSYTIK